MMQIHKKILMALLAIIFIGMLWSAKNNLTNLSPNIKKEIQKGMQQTDQCPPPDLVVCAKYISPADAFCQLLKKECALCGGNGKNPKYDTYTCYQISRKMTDYLINYVQSGCYTCYASSPDGLQYKLYNDVSHCCDVGQR